MKAQLLDGTRLWFDTEGLGLVPDGDAMRQRPTLIVMHGGPGGMDGMDDMMPPPPPPAK